jgi:tetratricopeptide (TPR) repeat protein
MELAMDKDNSFLSDVDKFIDRLRPVSYVVGLLIIYRGLVELIKEGFGDSNQAWMGVVLVLLLMVISLYWTWFRPVRRYKDIIKRSQKYIRKLNTRPRAIATLKLGLNQDNYSEQQSIDIRMRLGELYLQQGEEAEAEKWLHQGFDLARDSITYSELLLKTAWFYFEAEDYNQASEYLDKAFEVGSPYLNQTKISKDNLFDYICIYLGADRKDRAKEVYNMLVQKSIVKPNKEIEKLL